MITYIRKLDELIDVKDRVRDSVNLSIVVTEKTIVIPRSATIIRRIENGFFTNLFKERIRRWVY